MNIIERMFEYLTDTCVSIRALEARIGLAANSISHARAGHKPLADKNKPRLLLHCLQAGMKLHPMQIGFVYDLDFGGNPKAGLLVSLFITTSAGERLEFSPEQLWAEGERAATFDFSQFATGNAV